MHVCVICTTKAVLGFQDACAFLEGTEGLASQDFCAFLVCTEDLASPIVVY